MQMKFISITTLNKFKYTSPGLNGLLCGIVTVYPSFFSSVATACNVLAN